MSAPPRVRFAPSPTGFFHVGSARSTLFNWVFARQHGGTFVLRIEDTDAERNRPEWTQGILDAITWLGCDWDEGPFFQSERGDLYRNAVERLIAGGHCYWCDMTPEQIQAKAKEVGKPGYGGWSRDRGLGPGPGHVLRFRTPDEGSTLVRDLVRGDVTFEHEHIEDFVIQRSNGSPMFLLANVVDDIDMRITHVIRGEEHLPNTPKGILLWKALTDQPEPVWAHVPVLVNEQRKKLSKRRDKVALEMYRDEGYVRDAMVNYLMTLGWSPSGDREIVPMSEMIPEFRLEDVVPSPAFFDIKKLGAFNGDYLRAMSVVDFATTCLPWLEPTAWFGDRTRFDAVAELVQTRIVKLDEVPGLVEWLYVEPKVDADLLGGDGVGAFLTKVAAAWDTCAWEAEVLKAELERIGNDEGRKKAQVPVRIAITGAKAGLPLYEPVELLGRNVAVGRIRAASALVA
jgi:glutamyl-tRNA synthetase